MKMMDDRPREKKAIKREVPTMPEGYYSGDQPNPNLRAFVERHLKDHPYVPENDDYNVTAFNEPITTTKATAIYNMHTYWSKKPHDAIRKYIRHYTTEDDLVLDPLCGSGGTALAALMEGRKAIAIDRSPAATFITKNYCTPVDVDELKKAFEELKAKVKPEIDWLYETRCDRCGGKATTSFTVYSQVFQCPRCMEKVPLFDCVETEGHTKAGKPKKNMVCPYCYKNRNFEGISTTSKKFGAVPVMVSYICENGCKPNRDSRLYNDANLKKREYFKKYDLRKIQEIDEKKIQYWYPPNKMMNVGDDSIPWGVKWRAGTSNFRTVAELFTKRSLWAISSIFNSIDLIEKDSNTRDLLKFGLTGIILGISKMNQYRPDVSFPLNIMSGTYYMPQISKEEYIFKHYENKIFRIIKGFNLILNDFNKVNLLISTDDISKRALNEIPSNSIDYIFTDPPYADKIQYGELNFIWEAWLNLDTNWHNEEIIINEIRGKSKIEWEYMMHYAMGECYRILKPGRWVSLCYHDTSEGTWALIQDIMASCGFLIDKSNEVNFIDTGGKTYNQTQSDKVTKRDLVINFRKPIFGEASKDLIITGNEDIQTFNEKVTDIIRDYLLAHPSTSKDRIYDNLVSRMVKSGHMEAHDFNTILTSIAEPSKEYGKENVERWYLKETELEIIDTAESAKEDAAAEIINSAISKQLEKNPEVEGVHYSDIFEQYIYAVKDKPRRPLADWLPDYFYKTSEGTYRLPITEEEVQIKKDGRAKGLNRRIKRYIAFLEQGVSIIDEERPSDATLSEWIRHCRRSGMYEQGKLLYERGGITFDRLSDEQQVDVEENYQACIRALDRIGNSPDKKKVNNSKK